MRYSLESDEVTGMDIDLDINRFETAKFGYEEIFTQKAESNH